MSGALGATAGVVVRFCDDVSARKCGVFDPFSTLLPVERRLVTPHVVMLEDPDELLSSENETLSSTR